MQIGFILFILAIYLISPKDLYAADISHSVSKSDYHVTNEIEFDVTFSINASDGTQYYLRGVFSRPGDNNYCGYTWNGAEYFSGPYSTNEQWKNFQKVSVTNGTWSGVLKAKIDPEDSGCTQSGEYRFKIQRFTNSGGSTFDNQQESTLFFTIPTPTPTPSKTPTPTKVPTPTKTPKPTPTPKKSSTITINSALSDEENAALTSEILSDKNVYGTSTSVSHSPRPSSRRERQILQSQQDENIELSTTSADNEDKKGGNIFMYLGGTSMLTSCGILLFQTYRKRREEG